MPLPQHVARDLFGDRVSASRALGAGLHLEWPDPHLGGILARHADLPPETALFGVWVMVERVSAEVVGDIGFHGPPDEAGAVEVGYSVGFTPDGERDGELRWRYQHD